MPLSSRLGADFQVKRHATVVATIIGSVSFVDSCRGGSVSSMYQCEMIEQARVVVLS